MTYWIYVRGYRVDVATFDDPIAYYCISNILRIKDGTLMFPPGSFNPSKAYGPVDPDITYEEALVLYPEAFI